MRHALHRVWQSSNGGQIRERSLQCCCSRFHASASAAESDDLHAALSDKGLLKVGVGFIGGDFMGASDEATIDVRV